jgi:hypothetical protein
MKGKRSRTYCRTLDERPSTIESKIMVIMGCQWNYVQCYNAAFVTDVLCPEDYGLTEQQT